MKLWYQVPYNNIALKNAFQKLVVIYSQSQMHSFIHLQIFLLKVKCT